MVARRGSHEARTGAPRRRDPMAAARYKYVALHDALRDQILRSVFVENAKLPSESALGAQYGVSRVTVRLALDTLRQSGLIESRQGKGYFVRRIRVIQDLGRLQGFSEMTASLGLDACSE